MDSEKDKSVLDKWLAQKRKIPKKGIGKKPDDQPAVLSHGQERLWLLEQLYSNQNLYSYGHRYLINGQLDIETICIAFDQVVQKHEVLRSTYRSSNGIVEQIVHTDFEIPTTRVKSGNDSFNQIQKILSTPFNLEKDLPIRLCIHEISRTQIEVILVLHHIAGDAWSMNIINTELSINYINSSNKISKGFDELKLQYKDFAFWQKKQVISKDDLSYWKNKLGGETSALKLPTKVKQTSTFKGKWYNRTIPTVLTQGIEAQAKVSNVTLYVYWLTVFKVFLAKYTDQTEITVGSPFSTRGQSDLENIIGFFNETLVLKSDFQGNPLFPEVVDQVNQVVQEAFLHQNVPFEDVVNEINPNRSVGENPLFKVMFLYAEDVTGLMIPGLDIREEVIDMGVSKFDLTLFVRNGVNGIELVFEHTSRFEDDTIIAMMDHFLILIGNVVKNPEARVSDLLMLSESENQIVVQDWNSGSAEVPDVANISELISANALSNPHTTAVVFDDNLMTYQELDQWSNYIASRLIAEGVSTGESIGIYSERSFEMIVAIVSILKAGAAYLPLDPKYPSGRLEHMLSDSNTKFVLVHPNLTDFNFDINHIHIERSEKIDFSAPRTNSSDYAYIIYTSGSTGKPKGVGVSHSNLICSTFARDGFYEDDLDSFLLLSSFSFDSSIAGIFWSLCSGGTLVLPPDRVEQDIEKLSDIIDKYCVTHTLMLPTLYQVILDNVQAEKLKTLLVVIVAGEAVATKLRNSHFRILPETRLYNEYGPTEATVWCVAHEIKEDEQGAIPIGRPIPNTQAYILDRHLNPTPLGIEGRLFIGGNNVTNGYLNQQELTNEKFLKNPFGPGRIYNTGDLARWTKNGILDFVGRKDTQIKIRGQRVELTEIKEILEQIDDVEEAVLRVDEVGRNKILAYLRARVPLDKSEILQIAKKALPDHMIPAQIVFVDSFPLLPNGKVDVSKLPIPSAPKPETLVEPETKIQKQLVKIWKEVLKVNAISIHDNFFDIGGDSIQSIQIAANAKQEGLALGPTSIFEHQTISKLSASMSHSNQNEWSAVIPLKEDGEQPPLFCIHSGGAHAMFYNDLANEIESEHPVYAIQPKGLDKKQEYHKTISEMATDYIKEIKKVQPLGPYHLLGTCFSNSVGLDMLHQLKRQGDKVAVIYIVDSAPAYLTPPSPNGEKIPLRRMLEMVQDGNWAGILKKIRNRLIRANRKLQFYRTTDVQKDLYEMIDSLNELYSLYTWKSISTNIVLIRSSEFANKKGKQFHLDHWNLLSQNNLEVLNVDGHHKTLFHQPEVKELAKHISTHKSSLHKEGLYEI